MASAPTPEPGSVDLPEVIERYQRAHDSGRIDDAVAAFAPEAVVVDDGSTARGHDEIRSWLDRTTNEFTWERTLLEASAAGPGEWRLAQNLTGDFPGGTVDLRYRFTVVDGLIEQLTIG